MTKRGRSQRNARGRGRGEFRDDEHRAADVAGSSRGGDNDDALLNAVGRELDNIADHGPMRAHTPAEALRLVCGERSLSA